MVASLFVHNSFPCGMPTQCENCVPSWRENLRSKRELNGVNPRASTSYTNGSKGQLEGNPALWLATLVHCNGKRFRRFTVSDQNRFSAFWKRTNRSGCADEDSASDTMYRGRYPFCFWSSNHWMNNDMVGMWRSEESVREGDDRNTHRFCHGEKRWRCVARPVGDPPFSNLRSS